MHESTTAGPSAGQWLRSLSVDFDGIAREIVEKTRDLLIQHMSERQARELVRLRRNDVDRIASVLATRFANASMGLQDLARKARRELCVLAIKRSVPSFKADLASGMTPEEYFDRFYKGCFQNLDLPSHSISVVDPNLHTFLKRRKALPSLTRSLRRAQRKSAV